MQGSIHKSILTEYEKKQKTALENLAARISEVYSKVPEIEHLESQIHLEGLKCNKMILSGGASSTNAFVELTSKINLLKQQKLALLKKNGYPSDYLEIKYECPLCRDTGFVESADGTVKCKCYRQQMIKHLYTNSNLNLIKVENFSCFDDSLFSDEVNEKKYGIKISPRQNIKIIKEKCMEFVNKFDSEHVQNLYFCGPAGTGKTFMSNCISKELIDRGRTVLYQTAPMLFSLINEHKVKAFGNPGYDDSVYKNIFDVDLLIIDDLGTESESSARYAEFLTILNARHMNNNIRPCKTIISTNIEVKDLYKYYDERTVSRIIGSYTLLKFAGDDLRILKKSSMR
jgi:DNA replication protein DnaC